MTAKQPTGIVAALEAIAERPESLSTLASMTCPVLIIAGEDDTLTPPKVPCLDALGTAASISEGSIFRVGSGFLLPELLDHVPGHALEVVVGLPVPLLPGR